VSASEINDTVLIMDYNHSQNIRCPPELMKHVEHLRAATNGARLLKASNRTGLLAERRSLNCRTSSDCSTQAVAQGVLFYRGPSADGYLQRVFTCCCSIVDQYDMDQSHVLLSDRPHVEDNQRECCLIVCLMVYTADSWGGISDNVHSWLMGWNKWHCTRVQ